MRNYHKLSELSRQVSRKTCKSVFCVNWLYNLNKKQWMEAIWNAIDLLVHENIKLHGGTNDFQEDISISVNQKEAFFRLNKPSLSCTKNLKKCIRLSIFCLRSYATLFDVCWQNTFYIWSYFFALSAIYWDTSNLFIVA